jgi:hypothetical protein
MLRITAAMQLVVDMDVMEEEEIVAERVLVVEARVAALEQINRCVRIAKKLDTWLLGAGSASIMSIQARREVCKHGCTIIWCGYELVHRY